MTCGSSVIEQSLNLVKAIKINDYHELQNHRDSPSSKTSASDNELSSEPILASIG